MSYQQLRQSELFAGESWQVVYQAFSQINFQAYDFDTIRKSLVEYIQRSYPEDFNDWIENQEFIFIIDLIAYFGQSLAFRTDLNTRENFLDTATRKDSVLRLAKMLGYTPRRNFSSRGLLKLSAVKTTESIFDSNNNALSNLTINWNDPTNLDWFEQFVLIINAALATTNPFGLPTKTALIGGITTQLYALNNVPLRTVADSFSATVNGNGMDFESINPDFDPLGFFIERSPDPLGAKNLIYRNDGAGNASPNSGFFAYFKQGDLQFTDYNFSFPQENRVVDINVNGINELDVWVQQINDNGLVVQQWTKVPTVENVTYNSIDRQVRTIFSVITRDNDQISIRFGDGRFGQSPTGLFRIWYRVSNGLNYQIQSQELQNIQVTIPYTKVNTAGSTQEYSLTLTYSLQYGISNRDVGGSLPSETIDQIKQRAPQVYYTQNRMVNGEDYNIFPLQLGNVLRKSVAINRSYSGQSRYLDLNDPTGKTQNTIVYADDGILYRDDFSRSSFESLPTIKTALEIVQSDIQPLIQEIDLGDFFYTYYPRVEINLNPHKMKWDLKTSITGSSTGQFLVDVNDDNNYVPQPIGPGVNLNYFYLTEGALVKFQDSSFTNTLWAKIEQVTGNGTDPDFATATTGPVVLSQEIPDGYFVMELIPAFRQTFTALESLQIQNQITGNFTFALRYDAESSTWKVITTNNISLAAFSLANQGDNTGTNRDSSWLLLAQYLPGSGFWQFSTRNLRYIFESVDTNRFYFLDRFKVVDIQRNQAVQDTINILSFNTNPSPETTQLASSYNWVLVDSFVYADGYIEPRRVQVSFPDSDFDGVPDNPDIFNIIVDPNATINGSDVRTRYVYHQITTDGTYDYSVPDFNIVTFNIFAQITTSNLPAGSVGYTIDTGNFYLRNSDLSLTIVNDSYSANLGRADLNHYWKHYAPVDHRIDPAITNVIDMYVLTENYYQTVQTWLTSTNRGAIPTPPTTDDLTQQLSELENFKMVTDQLIWHSANFKLLFGAGAEDELRAQFKVIKVEGTTLTDNEVQTRVIAAINEFFNVDGWGFGENFFASELSSYIHIQLSGIVASVVIVPNASNSNFGNLYEIRSEPNQLFISTAAVSDVVILQGYTTGNIKIGSN